MFVFKIKDRSTAIDIVVTRALLALSALIVLIYRTADNYSINITIAILLFVTSLFIKISLLRFGVHKLLLVGMASVLLFVATHSLAFAMVLFLYSAGVKFLYKQPVVQVSVAGVKVIKMIGSNSYVWGNFTNIVLKDSLLTIDFKNNQLLQLTVEENNTADEKQFNQFCAVHLMQ